MAHTRHRTLSPRNHIHCVTSFFTNLTLAKSSEWLDFMTLKGIAKLSELDCGRF